MPAKLTPNQLAWVEALESGKFEQGQRTLAYTAGLDLRPPVPARKVKYCCLGVACVLAGIEPTTLPDNRLRFEDNVINLPPRAREFLGVNIEDPWIGNRPATDLNDNLGLSFKQIAAQVREHGLRSNCPFDIE